MAEELKDSGTIGDAGYPDTAPATGRTIDIGPSQSTAGQPDATDEGATISEPGEPDTSVETFFDPNDLEGKPELQAAYKQMQGAFTKRMQSLADQQAKIEAYDQFYANPRESLQRAAQQYGLTVQEAQAVANQQMQQQTGDKDLNFQTWQEVTDYIRKQTIDEVRQEIAREFAPVVGQVQNMQRKSIEQTLADIDPGWQQYEDAMKSNLQQHPTLAKDPSMLYRLSVPQEVLESRATQAALKKLEQRTQSNQVSGTSTTQRQTGGLQQAKTVGEAWEAAKKRLAKEGITG